MRLGPLLVNLTDYCPFQAGLSAAQQKMEGGPTDARDKPLHTLEDHLADPDAHPYCSVAGDLTIWRYGQRVELPSVHPTAVFRVVDTGGHFHGEIWDVEQQGQVPPNFRGKVIRHTGYEPLDVCFAACGGHGGLGQQQANVPDDGTLSNAANSLSSAFQAVGIDDVDPVAVAVIGLGILGLGVLALVGA